MIATHGAELAGAASAITNKYCIDYEYNRNFGYTREVLLCGKIFRG
jgi:hypothetical protein